MKTWYITEDRFVRGRYAVIEQQINVADESLREERVAGDLRMTEAIAMLGRLLKSAEMV